MKRVFAVLSLCLGFSVAFGLDGTLSIESQVKHPQTGAETTINLGTYTFDVFKDRRELVREIYGICQNPPEKIKTFIANRTNLGDTWIKIYFGFEDDRVAVTRYRSGFRDMLDCSYSKGKLDRVGDYLLITDTLDKIIQGSAEGRYFSDNFAHFIDLAWAEAKAKDINVSTPNKSIAIKFGTRVINPETGAESISTYPDFDYEFNVYDDRRELWKATFNACTKLRGNILNEIKNGNTKPTISVWYEHPQGGLAELGSLRCDFNSNGTYADYDVSGEDGYNYRQGKISAEKLSKKEIEKWADRKAGGSSFNSNFMTLIDMANAGTKQTKSSPKKKK